MYNTEKKSVRLGSGVFPILFSLVLIFCLYTVVAPSAWAETGETEKMESIDVSEYVLQAGGLLPDAYELHGAAVIDPNVTVKSVIYDGLCARQSEINIKEYNIPVDSIGPIFIEVLNEHPDLFYVSSVFSYSYMSSGVVTSVFPSYNSSYSENDIAAYRGAVMQIVGMLDPQWTDVEKLLFLHDYLVTHCEYDKSLQHNNAYDALVGGSTVCQGYALAFNDLCVNSGINAMVVSSRNLDHAWNLVSTGGEHFFVDCTWDDPSNSWYEGNCAHTNFMLSQSALYTGVADSKPHKSTDWTSGTVSVYDSVETSSQYDSAWWQGAYTAVPMIGHTAAYSLRADLYHIYKRDMINDDITPIPIPASPVMWPKWGSDNYYWSSNYCTVASLGDQFYFTLPTDVWSLSLTGETNQLYRLTEDELAQGYLYGIVNDGGTLFYNIGTQPYDTSFQRAEIHAYECDGFSYWMLSDSTVSITGCSQSGNVIIPSTLDGYTVSNLKEQLFYGKSGITSVTIPATVTYFGSDRNDNDWDYLFSYCWDLEAINVDANNPTFQSVDGVLFSKDGNTLINYPCNRSGEVYHTTAETICCTSFASSRNLKYLFLDNGDTTWYTYTFNNDPGLKTFYNPGGKTEQKVADEQSAGRVQDGTEGNPWCFFVNGEAIQSLPSDLQVIEEEAFRGAEIWYLIAPAGCELIETGAFADSPLEYLRVGANTVIEDGALADSVVVDRR